MNKGKTKIRNRILFVISVMMLLTFMLIGLIFNFAARQYIQSSAVALIDDNISKIEQAESNRTSLAEDENVRINMRDNNFRLDSNILRIDSDYNLQNDRDITDEMTEIITAVKSKKIAVTDFRNERIATAASQYLVSVFETTNDQDDEMVYWLIYADITGLSIFSGTINIFLIILVCIMFIFVVIVTFFLSSSITRPIQKLSSFALNIGRGDFAPNDFTFKDQEFEDLNMALNKSAKQLGIYDNEQKTFFQNVSHELRTPLMSIQCYAEGISCDLMDPKNASETILEETNRLTEMVKDLLYISKIDNITSTYATTKVELRDIIRECARRHQAVADKKQVKFSFDFSELPVYLDCVSELISRTVNNLISNAIRYASSEIILSCRQDNEQIEICVSDDGHGIDANTMPHIFERFYKGANGNYGIGLSIVKTIIEQHNGKISANNTDTGGAVFTVSLPCKTGKE
jgi:signal transduction histidine kinase